MNGTESSFQNGRAPHLLTGRLQDEARAMERQQGLHGRVAEDPAQDGPPRRTLLLRQTTSGLPKGVEGTLPRLHVHPGGQRGLSTGTEAAAAIIPGLDYRTQLREMESLRNCRINDDPKRVKQYRADFGSAPAPPRDTQRLRDYAEACGFQYNYAVTERAIRATMRRQPIELQRSGWDQSRAAACATLRVRCWDESRLGTALAPIDPFRKRELYPLDSAVKPTWVSKFGARSKKRIKLRGAFKWAAKSEHRKLYTYERIAATAAKWDRFKTRRRERGLMFANTETRAFGYRLCEECFRFVPDCRSLCTCQEGLVFSSGSDCTSDSE